MYVSKFYVYLPSFAKTHFFVSCVNKFKKISCNVYFSTKNHLFYT
jgi:hypothetical protein